ncbi:5-bromo-4-chloroindolyl phosphate hydrolysis family protein [Pararhodobacter oceanensis]|uniref:5-bromo-4-chloroindolyl phosphate hydrolysis family protein n=1 Tax=Pararhodobacter oceanensis TaxID=2172121 RepID=UPI003A933EC3
MARRFGGQYSPDPEAREALNRGATSPATTGSARKAPVPMKRVNPVGARVNLLFILPFLWAFSAFFRDPAGMIQHLGVFALLILAAWLTREGVIAQDAYAQRRIARRPAIPRKIFASVATGLGLGLAGFGSDGGLYVSAIFGVVGAVLHSASFGFDPLSDKGMEGIDEFQTERVARAVEGAEEQLAAMSDAIKRAKDRKVEARLGGFQTHVRSLLRAVENDPAQLSAARRYLGIYLRGARDATVKFADLYGRTRDAEARADYIALLDDLEENFMLRTETLIDSDRQQLEIEIDVLQERLEREGVRPTDPDKI